MCHVWHTLALMCAKNHLLIFSSFLDIWENVEWPRFFGPPGIGHALDYEIRRYDKPTIVVKIILWRCFSFAHENENHGNFSCNSDAICHRTKFFFIKKQDIFLIYTNSKSFNFMPFAFV